MDRGIFAPFEDRSAVPPLSNEIVLKLQGAYERLLAETAVFVLSEQEKTAAEYVGAVLDKGSGRGVLYSDVLSGPPPFETIGALGWTASCDQEGD